MTMSQPFNLRAVCLIVAGAFVGASGAAALGTAGKPDHFGTQAGLRAYRAVGADADDVTAGYRISGHSAELPAPVQTPEQRDQETQPEADQPEGKSVGKSVPVIGREQIEPVKNEHEELSYLTGLLRGFVVVIGFAVIITVILKELNVK